MIAAVQKKFSYIFRKSINLNGSRKIHTGKIPTRKIPTHQTPPRKISPREILTQKILTWNTVESV